MKRVARLFYASIIYALCSCSTTRMADAVTKIKTEDGEDLSKNVIIVHFDASVGKAPLLSAVKKQGCTVIYEYGIINAVALKIPEHGKKTEKIITEIEKVKGVIGVSRDRIMHINQKTNM